MKKISSLVCTVAAALAAGSAAHALPQHEFGSPTSRARSTSDFAGATHCSGEVCAFVFAQSFDDANGLPQGYVSVTIQDSASFSVLSVFCIGSEYAQGVSADAGKRAAAIQATLDPGAAGCSGFNTSEPIVVDIRGRSSGLLLNSETGDRTFQSALVKTRQKFRTDSFDVSFDGLVGNIAGQFSGSAETFRSTNVEKIK